MADISDLQPTNLGRVIAGATGGTAVAAIFLYEGLRTIGWQVELLSEPPMRLSLGCSVFAFGMALLNIHLVRHIKHIERHVSTSDAQPPQRAFKKIRLAPPTIEPMEDQILEFLSSVKSATSQEIAMRFNVGPSLIEFHMRNLERVEYVWTPLVPGRPAMWHLEQAGREHLYKAGKLK